MMELKDVETSPVETTLYSLSERAPAPSDRRDGPRHLTLFRVGTMVVDGARELCLIKNISAGGLMLRGYCPMEVGQRIAIELKTGEPLAGTVSWVRDDHIGMEFDQPIDVIAILSGAIDGPRPRMPRIEANAFVQVRNGASMMRGRACDISQGGIKVDCGKACLPAGVEVVVLLAGLPPQPGVVRWVDEGFAGVTFNHLIPFSTLIGWLQGQRETVRAA
jgi:PilZ domain